jgi:hypothetical protein
MRWLGVALLCGLWATTAQAVPKVPAKVLMSPNGRAVVEIQLEKDKPAAWRSAFADEDCFVDELRPLQPNTIRLIVLPSKAGIYRVILWDGVKVEDSVVLVIDATGGKPVPPTPDPVNPVDPVDPIKDQKLFVVLIEESAEAVGSRGAMLADKTLNDRFKEKGHKWRVADKDVVGPDGKPPADLKRFLELSKDKPLAQLFLVDEKGKIIKQMNAPKSAADMLAEIKKVGG